MKRLASILLTACCFLLLISCDPANEKKHSLVNPFIGTGGHGHTYPGATVPFGMVQLSPDTRLTGWDGCGGYHFSDTLIYGFSHTHLQGTGVFQIMETFYLLLALNSIRRPIIGANVMRVGLITTMKKLMRDITKSI